MPPSSLVDGTERRSWSTSCWPGTRRARTGISMISNVGPLYARRGRTADAERLLAEGKTFVDSLLEAQFTGPVHVGLVELALATGRIGDAAATAADGIARLNRTRDRYYQSELRALGARAEADRAELTRAGRDTATAAEAAAVAAGYRDELHGWVADMPRPDAYGGSLAADAAQAAAEARRADGVADPGRMASGRRGCRPSRLRMAPGVCAISRCGGAARRSGATPGCGGRTGRCRGPRDGSRR